MPSNNDTLQPPLPQPDRLVELQSQLSAIARVTTGDPDWDPVKKLVAELRAQDLGPRVKATFAFEGAEHFMVFGTVSKELSFGPHVFASWEFPVFGETGQFVTGFFVNNDAEYDTTPLPFGFFDEIEVDGDPDDYEGFPSDWWEACAQLGKASESQDGSDGSETAEAACGKRPRPVSDGPVPKR